MLNSLRGRGAKARAVDRGEYIAASIGSERVIFSLCVFPHYSFSLISLDGSKPSDSYNGRPCSLACK
jgi:hypothetical protein